MRQFFGLLLLVLIAVPRVWCQKMGRDFYHEAMLTSNDSVRLGILTYFVENYPRSKYCSDAYYRMGELYEQKGQSRLAINAYLGTLFDPYTRYSASLGNETTVPDFEPKAHAIDKLIDLYEKIGNYDSALKMLYYRDTGMNIFHGCGTGLDIAWEYTTVRYANLYLKIDRPKEAEKFLLSMHGFRCCDYQSEYEGVVGTKLKNVLMLHEDPNDLKKQIEEAVNNYFFDTSYSKYEARNDTLVNCCFYFLNVKICHFYNGMPGPWETHFKDGTSNTVPTEREKIIANLKKSELYILIQEL